MFVTQYARKSPVRVRMTGADYRVVSRGLEDTRKLTMLGARMVTVVRLQGYLFFGSAAHISAELADELSCRRTPQRCEVLLLAANRQVVFRGD